MKINRKHITVLLIFSGILSEIFYCFYLYFERENGNIPLYMLIYFEEFIIFFFAFFLIKRYNDLLSPGTNIKNGKIVRYFGRLLSIKEINLNILKMPLIIVGFGVLFRITLLPALPSTSPDAYRYIWEGKVIANGYNPYLLAPDNPELEHLRSDTFENINFKNMAAIYPPAAQYIFTLSYLFTGDNFLGVKIFYLLFDIITMIFILKLLYIKRINLNFILFYAWLPLIIMEFFINAHLDIIGISLLVMFLFYTEKGNYKISALFFSLSVLTKFYPVFIMPLLIKKYKDRRIFVFISIFILITVLFYIPFVLNNFEIFNFLMKYLTRWEFNGSVYNLLKEIFNAQYAHIISGLFLSLAVLIISFRYKNFINGVFGVFLSLIIFSTTLYPWYLGWIAALNPVFGFYSLFSLFYTINLSNFSPLGEVWQEYNFVLYIEYSVFYLLLIYDFIKRNRSSALQS